MNFYEELMQTYGLKKNDDFWYLEKAGVWIIKHKAVIKIAMQEGIEFSEPKIISSDLKNIALLVWASIPGKDRKAYAIGEASPQNCRIAYPWAIAEKRAQDRAVLKLIGAYVHDFYSDVEADEFTEPQAQTQAFAQGLKQNANITKIIAQASEILKMQGKEINDANIASLVKWASKFTARDGSTVQIKWPIPNNTDHRWLKSIQNKLQAVINKLKRQPQNRPTMQPNVSFEQNPIPSNGADKLVQAMDEMEQFQGQNPQAPQGDLSSSPDQPNGDNVPF